MKELVKVEGLQKSFGKFQALRDVSFTVNEGEVLGFIGQTVRANQQLSVFYSVF